MSAAVSAMQHQPGAVPNSASLLGNNSPVDNKRSIIKNDEPSRSSPQLYPSKLNQQTNASAKGSASQSEEKNNTDGNDTREMSTRDDGPQEGTPGDYFSLEPRPSRLDQEPNPFEQSFASGGTSGAPGDPLQTPKAILPPVTAMTSPAPLLGASSYNWGPHSLRSGPLSPAMLQGPTNSSDGLGFNHIRSGLTPNESGIRSGLTPGGSMFPGASPSTSIFFSGGGTPGTMEFQKTALSAARKSHPPPPMIPPPTQDMKMHPDDAPTNTISQVNSINQPNPHNDQQQKPRQPSDPFNDSAHNAANGLYMLAQLGGNQPNQYQQQQHQQQQQQHVQPGSMQQHTNGSMESSPNLAKRVAVNNANTANQNRQPPQFATPARQNMRGTSEMSPDQSGSDGEPSAQNGRKRNSKGRTASTGKRKEDASNGVKGPGSAGKRKRARSDMSGSDDEPDYDEDHDQIRKDGKKMTDEEKRKNFLERNRVAALKCRQRKKQWLANLQAKVEMYGSENDTLNATVQSLREEIVSLKTLLLAHKDCPVARANGIQMVNEASMGDGYGHIPMMQTGYPMMSQSVMHQQQQGPERRFS